MGGPRESFCRAECRAAFSASTPFLSRPDSRETARSSSGCLTREAVFLARGAGPEGCPHGHSVRYSRVECRSNRCEPLVPWRSLGPSLVVVFSSLSLSKWGPPAQGTTNKPLGKGNHKPSSLEREESAGMTDEECRGVVVLSVVRFCCSLGVARMMVCCCLPTTQVPCRA